MSFVGAFLPRLVGKLAETKPVANPGSKTVSAMMRVRDEGDFLEAAVHSIAGLVDEIVLIDNMSRDATPDIMARLAQAFPDRVRTFSYPYEIRKVGKDNEMLARDPAGRDSPELLANFYNWCLSKCTQNYVLKWDGDMIATNAFGAAMADFRKRPHVYSLWFKGVNVHENRTHLIDYDAHELGRLAAAMGDEDGQRYQTVRDNWLQAETDFEARLFPRMQAIYDNSFWWCEKLASPYVEGLQTLLTRSRWDATCYLHLKYCKGDPYANLSKDFKDLILGSMRVGKPLNNADARLIGQIRSTPARVGA